MTAIKENTTGDRTLLVVVLLLMIGSLPFTYSAAGQVVFGSMGGNYLGPLVKRMIFISISVGIIILLANIHFRTYNKLAGFIYFMAMLLLIITAFAGPTQNESRRVLDLGFLPFSFQTAAFAKVAMVIFAAAIMAKDYANEEARSANAKKVLVALGLMAVLTLIHGFSTTIILILTILLLLLVLRVNFKMANKHLFFMFLAPLLAFAVAELFKLPFRLNTWVNRAQAWMKGFSCDTLSAENYQACLSKSAIADGGFFGRGIGQSPLRYTLPEAHSDFIYSYIVDEAGMLTGILIIILYIIIFYRGIQIARKSHSIFPAALALGLTFLLIVQAFMNIGVAAGILPVTGQPLPFISKGGSSLIASSIAVGILLSISKHTDNKKTTD